MLLVVGVSARSIPSCVGRDPASLFFLDPGLILGPFFRSHRFELFCQRLCAGPNVLEADVPALPSARHGSSLDDGLLDEFLDPTDGGEGAHLGEEAVLVREDDVVFAFDPGEVDAGVVVVPEERPALFPTVAVGDADGHSGAVDLPELRDASQVVRVNEHHGDAGDLEELGSGFQGLDLERHCLSMLHEVDAHPEHESPEAVFLVEPGRRLEETEDDALDGAHVLQDGRLAAAQVGGQAVRATAVADLGGVHPVEQLELLIQSEMLQEE